MDTVIKIAFGFGYAYMILNAVLNWIHLRSQRRKAPLKFHGLLSVLIPARNEENNLPRLLKSLQEQKTVDFEVLVYDDQSEDETWSIIKNSENERISGIRGTHLPEGWVGKVHACYQLAQHAKGDAYLFLDADTLLLHAHALENISRVFESRKPDTVVTGITLFRGGGQLLVSMVGTMILCGLPWWLRTRVPASSMSGVNGQCWMVDSDSYHRFEPHKHVKGEVLEDIFIGRYLHNQGITPILNDLQQDVAVYMYSDLKSAWRGFRRNTSEMLGRSLFGASINLVLYTALFLIAPFFFPILILGLYGLKFMSDRITHSSMWITAVTPLSFFMAAVLAADSIVSRFRHRIEWKGRRIKSI